jgi:AcrR family transcriptional regulator
MIKAGVDERDVKILTSTEELIAELGYDRVRLIDIADRSGVSVGSLQHRYRTREALLRAAVERITNNELPALLGPVETIEDPLERIFGLVEHSLTAINPQQPSSLLWLELVIVSTRNEEVREVLIKSDTVWRSAFHRVFEEALAEGRLRSDLDALDLSMVVAALIDGCLMRRILTGERTDPLHQTELTIRVIHGPPPAPRRAGASRRGRRRGVRPGRGGRAANRSRRPARARGRPPEGRSRRARRAVRGPAAAP